MWACSLILAAMGLVSEGTPHQDTVHLFYKKWEGFFYMTTSMARNTVAFDYPVTECWRRVKVVDSEVDWNTRNAAYIFKTSLERSLQVIGGHSTIKESGKCIFPMDSMVYFDVYGLVLCIYS